MNTGLTDSNTIFADRSGWASACRSLALLLAVLCVGLANSACSTVCSAVDFVEIEFNADFRPPSAAGKIPVTKPEFRAPALDHGQHAVLSEAAVKLEAMDETIESQPIEFRAAAWYADKTKDKTEEKSEVNTWTHKPLQALGTNITLPGGAIPDGEGVAASLDCACCGCYCNRGWAELCYCFAATGLYYNPLYFEEVNLERYGYGCTPCLQSAASAAHFFGHVPLLPYMMATDCPSDCIYALGHYRPGNCVPWRRHCLPINKRGGLGQAGAIVGLVFLLGRLVGGSFNPANAVLRFGSSGTNARKRNPNLHNRGRHAGRGAPSRYRSAGG